MKRRFALLYLLVLVLSACGSGESAKLSDPVRARLAEDGQHQKIDILVDHAYKPNNVVLRAGVPTTVNFYRKEARESCARDLEIPELDIAATLPNNDVYTVELPPLEAGRTIPFHCSMKMMTGQIMVLNGEA